MIIADIKSFLIKNNGAGIGDLSHSLNRKISDIEPAIEILLSTGKIEKVENNFACKTGGCYGCTCNCNSIYNPYESVKYQWI